LRHIAFRIAALGALATLGACAHNDVLVFGTETNIGLDISTTPADGGTPKVNIGYKRTEAVWMPLFVSARGNALNNCTTNSAFGFTRSETCTRIKESEASNDISKLKYQSEYTEASAPGAYRTDAYSVFASLGAKIEGKGGSPSATVGIAQFFATGAAAVNVSENTALVTALKATSGEGSASQSDAVKAAAAAKVGPAAFDAIMKNMSSPDTDKAKVAVNKRKQEQDYRISRLVTCARNPTDGTWRWADIISTAYPLDKNAAMNKYLTESTKSITTSKEVYELLDGQEQIAKDLINANIAKPECKGE